MTSVLKETLVCEAWSTRRNRCIVSQEHFSLIPGLNFFLIVTMLNDYAYTVNSSWEDRVSFPFEKQEPSTQPGTEKVLEKYLLNQRE